MAYFWARGTDVSLEQLIHQLLQRQATHGLADCRIGFWSGKPIEKAGLATGLGIEADVAQRALPLLIQPTWHPQQPDPIAKMVLQQPFEQGRR